MTEKSSDVDDDVYKGSTLHDHHDDGEVALSSSRPLYNKTEVNGVSLNLPFHALI